MNKQQNRNHQRTGRPWAVGLFLFFSLLPIWPVEGLWFGLPAWAVLVVVASFAMSVFIAWWIEYHWPEDHSLSSRSPENPE